MTAARIAKPSTNGTKPGNPEKLVIGTILRDGAEAMAKARAVFGPLDFGAYAHQLVFRVALQLHDRGEAIDAHSVAVVLRERGELVDVRPDYLAELATEYATTNLDFHIKHMHEWCVRRLVAQRAQRLLDLANLQGLDVGDLLTAAKAEIETITDSGSHHAALETIPASALKVDDENTRWIVARLIEANSFTLFSSLWKAGKTTWLSRLLKALEDAREFCGLTTTATRVLCISEESEQRWARRCAKLSIGDHVHFICRKKQQTFGDWQEFINKIRRQQEVNPFGLIVFDTLPNIWPVEKENDAGQVTAALAPLNALLETAAVIGVHHLSKEDRDQARGSRGSGSLPAFADAIIEFRRFNAKDANCTKRVLSCSGRSDEMPPELVVEWDRATGDYSACGDRAAARRLDIIGTLELILPREAPGMEFDAIKGAWPEDEFPRKKDIIDALAIGFREQKWIRYGTGRRGSPYTFWIQDDSVSVPDGKNSLGTETP
jgi:hypothetical protein